MAEKITRRGGKKNRKHGREKRRPSHARYLAEKRWVKNKARKIAKYMSTHPNWHTDNLTEPVRLELKIKYGIIL